MERVTRIEFAPSTWEGTCLCLQVNPTYLVNGQKSCSSELWEYPRAGFGQVRKYCFFAQIPPRQRLSDVIAMLSQKRDFYLGRSNHVVDVSLTLAATEADRCPCEIVPRWQHVAQF